MYSKYVNVARKGSVYIRSSSKIRLYMTTLPQKNQLKNIIGGDGMGGEGPGLEGGRGMVS
jgi:hypothetical protein